MVNLESGTSRSRAVMGYRKHNWHSMNLKIWILPPQKWKLRNESCPEIENWFSNRVTGILKTAGNILSSFVWLTVDWTENEKFEFLRLTGPILKNEIGFFRWGLRLGGFWIKIRNLNLVQKQNLGIRNLEILKRRTLIESIWQSKIRDQKLKIWRTWNWFWWIWEIELSKSEIKNQVESSGNWDQNPKISWLSADFWLIWDLRRSNWRTRILELNQLKTKRLKSVE